MLITSGLTDLVVREIEGFLAPYPCCCSSYRREVLTQALCHAVLWASISPIDATASHDVALSRTPYIVRFDVQPYSAFVNKNISGLCPLVYAAKCR